MIKDKRKRQEYFNARRALRMEFIRNYKLNKCCAHCNYNEHPEILQFHHLDPFTKEFDFSGSEIGNLSMDRIQKEMNKCILLYPNRHQWLHFSEHLDVN